MSLYIRNKKNNFKIITMEGRECFVFLPKNYADDEKHYPVVYLNGDKSNYSLLKNADFLQNISFIIIGIISENRLKELTPWRSPSLNPKFPDFGGGGDEYIKFIETKLKPKVDLKYRTLNLPKSTAIMGYSLGGLISIYSAFNTECFGCFVSMSGSFWYPEFISYIENNSIKTPESTVYISSGDKEGEGSNDIKKDAVIYTNKVYEILSADLTKSKVDIFWDKGGHHDNVYKRYENALLWLNCNLQGDNG